MKRLVYLLLFLSVGLNAQVLRTYPPYVPPTATEEEETSSVFDNALAYWSLDESGTTFDNAIET